MNIAKLESLIRLFIINLISFSMITNSIASTSVQQASAEQLNRLAETINANKFGPTEVMADFQKFDSKKGHELAVFFAANPEYRTIQIPKTIVENGKLSFVIEGKKSLFSIDKNGRMDIVVGDKKIKLDYAMTFEQMTNKISETLGEKHFSFLNFFIQDLHASLAVAATLAIITTALIASGVYVLYGKYLKLEFTSSTEIAKKVCAGVGVDGVTTQQQLKDIHDQLFDNYINICMPVNLKRDIGFLPKGYDKDACDKVTDIRLCIKKKIETHEQEILDDSRAHIKDNKYESPGIRKDENSSQTIGK
ncbi:MAG: hypothetical protein PHY93_20285 [Bacteriovorax sp.]|nr:hypothetical protein [Bacteriovorax sp.]